MIAYHPKCFYFWHVCLFILENHGPQGYIYIFLTKSNWFVFSIEPGLIYLIVTLKFPRQVAMIMCKMVCQTMAMKEKMAAVEVADQRLMKRMWMLCLPSLPMKGGFLHVIQHQSSPLLPMNGGSLWVHPHWTFFYHQKERGLINYYMKFKWESACSRNSCQLTLHALLMLHTFSSLKMIFILHFIIY